MAMALAAAALALALAAPSSAFLGEPVSEGELVLKPVPANFAVFTARGIEVEPTGQAFSRGDEGKTRFPISWGHLQEEGPVGRLLAKGGLAFDSASAPRMKFRRPTVRLGERSAKIYAVLRDAGGGTIRFLDLDLSRAEIGGRAGENVKVMGARATLAKAAAERLSSRFGVPLRKGLPIGLVNIKAKFAPGS
jgi:hypothetical protein